MIDANTLLADARRTVSDLVDDLRQVAVGDPTARAQVGDEYQRAHAAGRTALGQAEWAEGLYAQVAVAWTLGCVFVRFCEDNGLITEPLLGGPGLRAQLALDQRAAHLSSNPAHDDRHWLLEVFGRLRALPATGDVFGPHNPVWLDGLLPSADGARRLREEFARLDPTTGQLRHDFTDPEWDTRFLGDLYQDLSDHAKKTYALLQTPVFVEEFILDRTLDPAISTFGLADTTIIDPTCGSGHFLLGAFERLFKRWIDEEPATNRRALAQRTLDAIGGIDVNPFAASIARFRLLLAALRAGDDTRLADAPSYDLNIAVGDSLLHGDPPGALPGLHIPGEEEALVAAHGYAVEDHAATRDLLRRQWTAVVGNPPYIVVRDQALNVAYRRRFATCHRQYSLGVPFAERFWQLARHDATDPGRAGYVGMITANSFMKREFGKKLIEQWVPLHDLTHVIDSSGAHIPGHGIETVIIFGRNRAPVARTVRAALGRKGEPNEPPDPRLGQVWQSIVQHLDLPGTSTPYISVVDLDRTVLSRHPWTLGGGGANELKDRLDAQPTTLGDAVEAISSVAITREDEAYFAPRGTWSRHGVPSERIVPVGSGEVVRDFQVRPALEALFPYDETLSPTLEPTSHLLPLLWPTKQYLLRRKEIGGYQTEVGKTWFEWNRFLTHRYVQRPSIVFAHVAPANHFVLDDTSTAFIRSAPSIKMPTGTPLTRFHELLGVLNSSTAAFWLHQVMQRKSNDKGRGSGEAERDPRFDHDNTKLKMLPLPSHCPASTGAELAELGNELGSLLPVDFPTTSGLRSLADSYVRIRSSMIAAQERLDWECYRAYGLVQDDLAPGTDPEPPLQLGERAFEIVLARRMAEGGEQTSWFVRYGSTPTTELPSTWSEGYRRLVERRIELIETDPHIGLIERPEHKRRWGSRPWDEQVEEMLRTWLLDRLEHPRYWPTSAAISTVARLTSDARADKDFVEVARLYAGRDDVDLAALISSLLKSESVAYLAAHRFTESGLRTHALWLKTWDLQRREDEGEDVGTIPAPPKYGKADFTGTGWTHRGKLDVPKERFISYPGAERETDASSVIGWAGWDHLDRARALAAWYLQAKRDGRDKDHLTPLLAGLAELVPWLKQWHDEPNSDPSLDRPGSQVAALVDAELRSLGLTHDDLVAWRPPATAKRGRPRKASA